MDVYCFQPILELAFDTHSIKVTENGFTISACFSNSLTYMSLFASYERGESHGTFEFELDGLVKMKCFEECDPHSLMFVERKNDSVELERGYGVFEFLDDKFSLIYDLTEFGKLSAREDMKPLSGLVSAPREVGEFEAYPWFESDRDLVRLVSLSHDQNFRPVIVFHRKEVWVLSSRTEQHLALGWLRSDPSELSFKNLGEWMKSNQGKFLVL